MRASGVRARWCIGKCTVAGTLTLCCEPFMLLIADSQSSSAADSPGGHGPTPRHVTWRPSSVLTHSVSRRRRCGPMTCHAYPLVDVEYGHKQTVTTLLQEWVSDVGARAGLTHTNTRLSSGSVGVAESRLEVSSRHRRCMIHQPSVSYKAGVPTRTLLRLTRYYIGGAGGGINLFDLNCTVPFRLLPQLEVTFPSLSEWEHFLANIPAKEHKAWSQRVQGMIVGGSPRWELYRAVPAFADGQEQAAAAAPVARPAPTAPVLALPASVLTMQAALQQSRVSCLNLPLLVQLLWRGCVAAAGFCNHACGGRQMACVNDSPCRGHLAPSWY